MDMDDEARRGKKLSLLGMADEIILHIASFLNPKDLLTLRLVTEKLAECTQKEMLAKNFTELHVIPISPQSLNRALEVAKHPLLSPAIKSFVLYLDNYQSRPMALRNSHQPGPIRPLYFVRGSFRNGVRLERDVRESNLEYHQDSLRDIFRQLRTHGHRLDVSFDCIDLDPSKPKDYRRLSAQLGEFPRYANDHEAFWILVELTLKVPKETDTRLSAFRAGLHLYDYAGVPLPILIGADRPLGLRECFDGLEHLSLRIEEAQRYSIFTCRREDCEDFVDFLKAVSRNLKTLWLETICAERPLHFLSRQRRHLDYIFPLLVQQGVHFPKIEEMHFGRMLVHYNELVGFMARHASTLKRRSFRHVSVDHCELGTFNSVHARLLHDAEVNGLPPPEGREGQELRLWPGGDVYIYGNE